MATISKKYIKIVVDAETNEFAEIEMTTDEAKEYESLMAKSVSLTD
jgi:hypothetical protein